MKVTWYITFDGEKLPSRRGMKKFIEGHACEELLILGGMENYPTWYTFLISQLTRPNQIVYLQRYWIVNDRWSRIEAICEFLEEYA